MAGVGGSRGEMETTVLEQLKKSLKEEEWLENQLGVCPPIRWGGEQYIVTFIYKEYLLYTPPRPLFSSVSTWSNSILHPS